MLNRTILEQPMRSFVSLVIFSFLCSGSAEAQRSVSADAQPDPHLELVCPPYAIVSPLYEQKQEVGDWCTFAASRVVTKYFGMTYQSQCELLERVVGRACCPVDDYESCHPEPPIWPAEVFDKVNVLYLTHPSLTSTALTFAEIQDSICVRGRPIISVASLQKKPEGPLDEYNWHAVVVEGYWNRDGLELVRVFDPQEDLCASQSANTCGNPRFLTYDQFFLSGFEHHTDYLIKALTHSPAP